METSVSFPAATGEGNQEQHNRDVIRASVSWRGSFKRVFSNDSWLEREPISLRVVPAHIHDLVSHGEAHRCARYER